MAAKDSKDAKPEKKDATIIIKTYIDCKCWYKKVWRILCKLQGKEKIQITSTSFDEKNKTATISGPFDAQAVIQKIKCMACKYNVTLDVQVKPDPPPPATSGTTAPAGKTTPPTTTPTTTKPPVCEGDKKLTVKVDPKITVGAVACCHHAQGGHHHGGCKGGCKSSSSCEKKPECHCRTSSCEKKPEGHCRPPSCEKKPEGHCRPPCCEKKPECRCGTSSCGKAPERCCSATHHHVCSGGCSSGPPIVVCGQPPCKVLFEDHGNPSCRIM